MKSILTETDRLVIKEFDESMAQAVHELSVDENNRRFQPDEVFETVEDARQAIVHLSANYGNVDAPQVYPVILKEKRCNIGHVELVPIGAGEWEIGYHIGEAFTRKGYASEAVKAFLPVMMKQFGLDYVMGICAAENVASRGVMEKCGFVKEYEDNAMYHGELRPTCRYRFTPKTEEHAMNKAIKIENHRFTPEEYIDFLKRTDLGSQYPKERFEERIPKLLVNVSVSLAAFDENGKIVGALLGLTDFAYWLYVTDLGVDRDYTHQGIGRALMKTAHEIAGGEKDIAVYLIANENAVPFYEKLGMKLSDDVMQYNHIEWTEFTVE